MKIRMRSLSHVLVGLDRIGLLGLEQVFEEAEKSDQTGREELVSLMMEALSRRNYVPSASQDAYRQALWREYERVAEKYPQSFAQRQIVEAGDIFPVFHDLFEKKS